MKKLKITWLLAISSILLLSCAGNTSSQPANGEGFSEIEKEIKTKFGDNAYFTDLTISYDNSIGNMINVTVTKDPESLKMEQWHLSQNAWTVDSEITLEVPEGSKAADFMFQLNNDINLKQLGDLVEKSIKDLKAEKNIENPTLSMAFVNYPDNGDISKATYNISLKPENGGTSFNYIYSLDGEIQGMNY